MKLLAKISDDKCISEEGGLKSYCGILLPRWKLDGPSDSFLALVDMAAVHSTCRLCIHLATQIRLIEEAAAPKRPCHCTSVSGDIHHIYVRERGRFESLSIFIK